MKFDDLDARMRAFEEALDVRLPEGGWVVARLDGRGFSKLMGARSDLQRPFDDRVRDAMIESARLAASEFNALLAHTHSDEMSLLLSKAQLGWAFEGKARKYLSLMASMVSVSFSLAFGHAASFDCRLVALPSAQDVVDYFRWRASDSERNALSAHAYWNEIAQGLSPRQATALLDSLSPQQKIERLASHGVDYSSLPSWHKRGSALLWRYEEIEGRDPRTGERKIATRRRLRAESEIPEREDFAALIRHALSEARPIR